MIASIILSAGFGERMQQLGIKPLLEYNQKTFVEHAFEKSYQNKCNPIVIITNRKYLSDIKQLKLPSVILLNDRPEEGMLSSLTIGLDYIGNESDCLGTLSFPIDFPLVSHFTIHNLIKLQKLYPNHIIKPFYNNKSGHPIIIPRKLFSELLEVPKDTGVRFITKRNPHITINVQVQDPGIHININSPEQYKKYIQQNI